MMFVLTCALCAAAPEAGSVAPPNRSVLIEERLSIGELDRQSPVTSVPLSLAPLREHGSGGGDDHSDHMSAMWIVMGAMMAVMMVGMGIYFMNHGARAQAFGTPPLPSPAQFAIPVSGPRGGG